MSLFSSIQILVVVGWPLQWFQMHCYLRPRCKQWGPVPGDSPFHVRHHIQIWSLWWLGQDLERAAVQLDRRSHAAFHAADLSLWERSVRLKLHFAKGMLLLHILRHSKPSNDLFHDTMTWTLPGQVVGETIWETCCFDWTMASHLTNSSQKRFVAISDFPSTFAAKPAIEQ